MHTSHYLHAAGPNLPHPLPRCTGHVIKGSYPYTYQLLQLHSLDNSTAGQPRILSEKAQIVTPLNSAFWKQGLADHPDKDFASFITQGLQHGFRIGFNPTLTTLHSKHSNHRSATLHPGVITEYLEHEVERGRVAELKDRSPTLYQGLHVSPIGVVPKKGKHNKWRMITDLSSPQGHSVNDGITKESCSFHYTSINEAAKHILSSGPGTLMAKMDIQHAYRNIPVAPEDRHLLGMSWNGRLFVDRALPFGLRSAPLLFSAIADALLHIMLNNGVSWAIHYLDDFFTSGTPASAECLRNMHIMQELCRQAGLPLEPAKTVGPTTTLTFLGIEIDSVLLQIRLPQAKLVELKATLALWRDKTSTLKHDLLSLIGSLSHASKVIHASRVFLRRLIDLSTRVRKPEYHIRLNIEARSDIEWWYQFVEDWNGVSILGAIVQAPVYATLITDASGTWGCGAYVGSAWFQLHWAGHLTKAHISVKELVPIVIAVGVWGHQWIGKTIMVRSDNTATVAAVNSHTSQHADTAHLLRCLTFLLAKCQCRLVAEHLPGTHNTLADALSRNNLLLFRQLLPQAATEPTTIPLALIQLLMVVKPDWTSQHWTELWSTIWRMG